MSMFLAHNLGAHVTYQAMAATLHLSFKTIKKYIEAMEKSYLIVSVPPLCNNNNKEIAKQPKLYFLDTGLCNALLSHFPTDPEGPVFVNYVLTELMKEGFSPVYWRTKSGAEVDFVVDGIRIECKVTAHGVPSGIRSFIRAYKPEEGFVVCYIMIQMKK